MEFRITEDGKGRTYFLIGRLTFRDNEAFSGIVAGMAEAKGAITLNLAGLDYLDSFGVGLMLLARDEAERRGVPLTFASPAQPVRDLFEHMGLLTELPFDPPLASGAPTHAVTASAPDHLSIRPLPSPQHGVALGGRFTVSEQAKFLVVIKSIAELASGSRFIIDLANLTYMDSGGLSLILVANDEARQVGATVELVNATARVKDLLRIAAVDLVMPVS
ncbi:STAS domain-containing protein [Magnetospirillum sp. UT-4]|uniref:STAS domain-containing protein n=1 Tax=Magnetospirillum sp. UT-4 TaxID=2681467 RepID=UPI00137F2EFD|nr:STAS domain-containing protein [Magnetospirillum sp. UT-4]CAA7618677.1 conserved hypothetical protein [Magnetospirillum sp. UT-4]